MQIYSDMRIPRQVLLNSCINPLILLCTRSRRINYVFPTLCGENRLRYIVTDLKRIILLRFAL